MQGLFGRLAAPSRKEAQTLDQLPGFLLDAGSKTGIAINWSTALQVTAMYACCRVVGEGLAAARCRLLRPRSKGGYDQARDHSLYRLLFLEPSKGLTAFSLWETIAFHVMLVGNAFVFVNRVGEDRIHELLLLDPGKVQVTKRPDQTYSYAVAGDGGSYRPVPDASIWHIRGPSWNGWMGMEPVRLAREALGLSLALEASHAEIHRDGVKPSGAYSVEGELTGPQYEQLSKWLKRFAAAGDLAGSPLILDKGAKWLSQQMTGVDLQHLETRRYQVEETCRAARVLPIMVGLADKVATYSSSEQMFLAHGMFTMTPWAGRIEQSIEVGLLTEADQREGLVARFNLNASMRGDYKSRQEGLQIQRRNGVINADEWRELEDWNPRDDAGGAQYIVEGNMAVQDGRDLTPVATPPKAKE
ncbi:phage portal protein [Sphingomonas melonis]|uniref:HK97 family phage portal protein n=1 Tax=Sphingomonas melonis TaxID=152682 RepID=A0A7Y9FQ44_9SPHN|nr:phage portal protein [Sphingomonas melonis]NYD91403.1 HK97 family phage portal protein [Sphingomonas melonis]